MICFIDQKRQTRTRCTICRKPVCRRHLATTRSPHVCVACFQKYSRYRRRFWEKQNPASDHLDIGDMVKYVGGPRTICSNMPWFGPDDNVGQIIYADRTDSECTFAVRWSLGPYSKVERGWVYHPESELELVERPSTSQDSNLTWVWKMGFANGHEGVFPRLSVIAGRFRITPDEMRAYTDGWREGRYVATHEGEYSTGKQNPSRIGQVPSYKIGDRVKYVGPGYYELTGVVGVVTHVAISQDQYHQYFVYDVSWPALGVTSSHYTSELEPAFRVVNPGRRYR